MRGDAAAWMGLRKHERPTSQRRLRVVDATFAVFVLMRNPMNLES